MSQNCFLLRNKENLEFNQYWYSGATISEIVNEIKEQTKGEGKIGFISTPSLFFSMSPEDQSRCYLFEIDNKFEKKSKGNFVFFDFNKPNEIPSQFHSFFSYVIADPPFITRDVWEKYAQAIKTILIPNGKILVSTIAENENMMHDLLGVVPRKFKPSIPNLTYQYNFFSNYGSHRLNQHNPEIPSE